MRTNSYTFSNVSANLRSAHTAVIRKLSSIREAAAVVESRCHVPSFADPLSLMGPLSFNKSDNKGLDNNSVRFACSTQ